MDLISRVEKALVGKDRDECRCLVERLGERAANEASPEEKRMVVATLNVARHHADEVIRGAALLALGGLGEASVPVIERSISDTSASVRAKAVAALIMALVGQKKRRRPKLHAVERVLDLLEHLAKDESSEVRTAIAYQLGRLGSRGLDPWANYQIRWLPRVKLKKASKSKIVSQLAALLNDHDWETCLASAKSLWLMAPDGRAALENAADNGTPQTRAAVLNSIEVIDLNDLDPDVRKMYGYSHYGILLKPTRRDLPAVQRLIGLGLRDSEPSVCLFAGAASLRIRPSELPSELPEAISRHLRNDTSCRITLHDHFRHETFEGLQPPDRQRLWESVFDCFSEVTVANRWELSFLLDAIDQSRSFEGILRACNQESPNVRAQALKWLADITGEHTLYPDEEEPEDEPEVDWSWITPGQKDAAFKAIERGLEDESLPVRVEAARAFTFTRPANLDSQVFQTVLEGLNSDVEYTFFCGACDAAEAIEPSLDPNQQGRLLSALESAAGRGSTKRREIAQILLDGMRPTT